MSKKKIVSKTPTPAEVYFGPVRHTASLVSSPYSLQSKEPWIRVNGYLFEMKKGCSIPLYINEALSVLDEIIGWEELKYWKFNVHVGDNGMQLANCAGHLTLEEQNLASQYWIDDGLLGNPLKGHIRQPRPNTEAALKSLLVAEQQIFNMSFTEAVADAAKDHPDLITHEEHIARGALEFGVKGMSA